jgi:hypothetical protein
LTPPEPRNPYQFSIRTLFGVTVVLSMLAAIGGNIIRRGDDVQRVPETIVYVILALCAPFIALAGASIYRAFMRRGKGKRTDRF